MDIFAGLPGWAVVVLSVLAAAILIALNVGWLLQTKALLDARRRKPEATNHDDTKAPRI